MSRKSRKKKRTPQRTESSTTHQIPSHEQRGFAEEPGSGEHVDTIRRLNVRFIVVSLAIFAVSGLAVHLVHGFVVDTNAQSLLDLANEADEDGRREDTIRLLTQYVKLQLARETEDSDLNTDSELTDQFVRLGVLLDHEDATADDLIQAYRTYEEVLRRDPHRFEVRRRTIDIAMRFGRFGNALDHIEELVRTTELDDETLGELQLLSGRCNLALGDYVDAQRQYLESISRLNNHADGYLELARFWLESERIIERGPWFEAEQFRFLHPALPDVKSGGSRAVKSAFTLLDIMVEHVQPAAQSHLRRAQFLSHYRPTGDSSPMASGTARIAARETILNADGRETDPDGILTESELWHSQVPPLADLDADGRVDESELTDRFMAGDKLARLRHAERSILTALEATSDTVQENANGLVSEILLAAADIYLALFEAARIEEFGAERFAEIVETRRENQRRYAAAAERFTRQGRELENPDAQFYLTAAKLELQRTGDNSDFEEQLDRLLAADALLRQGLALLDAKEAESSDAVTHSERSTNIDTRLKMLWMLADVLYSQSNLFDGFEPEVALDPAEIIEGLRRSVAPQKFQDSLTATEEHLAAQNWREAGSQLLWVRSSLDDTVDDLDLWRHGTTLLMTHCTVGELQDLEPQPHVLQFISARQQLLGQNWEVARRILETLRNRLPPGSDMWRRATLLLAYCYDQLVNPDAKLNLYRVALQTDPLWKDGLLGEVDALLDLTRLDEAIDQYRRLVSTPEDYERLAGLLLLQQVQKARRDWSRVSDAIDAAAQEGKPESHQLVTLKAELIWQQAFELWQHSSQTGDEAGQSAAIAQLDEAERLLRNHRDNITADDPEAWSILAVFVARRFDSDTSRRFARAQGILEQAVEQLGDSVELRLAAVQIAAQLQADRISELLEGLDQAMDGFSQNERYRLHEAMAEAYARAGVLDQAIESWEKASLLSPNRIVPHVAILELMLVKSETGLDTGSQDDRPIVAIDDNRWDKTLDRLETLEGPDGPLTTTFMARRIVADAKSGAESGATRTPEQLSLRLDEARDLLATSQKQRPYWSAIPLARAGIETLLGNWELTIANFERAIALGERSPAVLLTIIQHYDRLAATRRGYGQLAETRDAEEKADRYADLLNQQNPALLTGALGRLAAQVYRNRGEFGRAIELQRNVSEDSENPLDLIQLARLGLQAIRNAQDSLIEEQSQTLADVESLLKEAVHRGPELPDTWIALIEFYVMRGRASDAEQIVQEASDSLPIQPAHLRPLTLARCHELLSATQGLSTEEVQGHRSLAEEYYRQALDTDPGNTALKLASASFYLRSNNSREAILLLDAILADPEIATDFRSQVIINKALAIFAAGTRAGTDQALEILREDIPSDAMKARNLQTQAMVLDRRDGPGDARELLHVLEQISELEPLTAQGRFLLAAMYDRVENDWDKARAEYEEILSDNPDNTPVRAALVQGLLRRVDEGNNLAAARSHFNQLQSREPQTFRTHSIEARLAAAEGAGDEAAGRLAEYVRRYLVNRPAAQLIDQIGVNNLAELSRHLFEIAEAQQDQGAKEILIRINEAIGDGRQEDAIAALRTVGRAQWVVAELQIELLRQAAVLLEQLDQTDIAEDLFREYANESARPQAVLALVQFLARQGRHQEGFTLCEQNWDRIPVQNVAATTVSLLRDGDFSDKEIDRIAPRLEQAVADAAQAGDQVVLLMLLADLRDQQSRYAEAQAAYVRILQLNADHIIALNNLAWLNARQGQPLPALELIDRAISTAGPYPELLDTMGVVLIAVGRPAQAVDILQRAVGERPDAQIYLHLAEAHWRNDNLSAARQSLEKAKELGLDPQSLHPLDRSEHNELTQVLIQE